VLRRAERRAALIARLADVDRLVLLGDVLELRHGPLRDAVDAALPVIRDLGEALGEGMELVIVPGNHDHRLLRAWLERRALTSAPAPLGLESPVEWLDGEPLGALAEAARPATVRGYYPGLWLRDDVYATHGHYLDRHITVPILERLGAGVMARIVPEPAGGPARAEDYEMTLGPLYAWVDAIAQAGGAPGSRKGSSLQVRAWRALAPGHRRGRLRRAGVGVGFAAVIGALNRAGIGPLRPGLSGHDLRRGGLRAFAQVLARLGVGSPYAIFGHTHRAGPLVGDDEAEWITGSGTSVLNTGSWLDEPGLLGRDPARSPYRPGFCVLVDDDGPPRLENLLDA
jgi:predicted phosphodiesterase